MRPTKRPRPGRFGRGGPLTGMAALFFVTSGVYTLAFMCAETSQSHSRVTCPHPSCALAPTWRRAVAVRSTLIAAAGDKEGQSVDYKRGICSVQA
eukprot:650906-Pleurochrysis_carterae.AAC.2